MSDRVGPRIGCAGWSISTTAARLFDDGSSMLARYATRFNCVEINSSFYRPHQRTTYERWAAAVPVHFRFSVKVPKAVTHERRLQGVGNLLDPFFGQVEGLGEKLAGLLVQLPPSLAFDARRAATFFAVLRRRTSVALACEPRHATWFTPAARALLQRFDIGRVAADPAPFPGADDVGGGGPWRYWRWHGSPHRYYSRYDIEALAGLSDVVRVNTPKGITPWIIFDNTAHGFATTNALELISMTGVSPRKGTARA